MTLVRHNHAIGNEEVKQYQTVQVYGEGRWVDSIKFICITIIEFCETDIQ